MSINTPADLFSPAFEVLMPDTVAAPLIYNSPHSGRHYPDAFLRASRLDPHALRKSEDCYVDELFAGVVALGAPLMHARFPRAYLDLNREPYELDPTMFDGPLPHYVNARSARAAGGLGTIARIVSESQEIYAAPLAFAEARARIETLYKPYHARLRALLDETRSGWGAAVMVDCHSMPSTLAPGRGANRPDFVLGDRFGAACASEITDFVEARLAGLGYSVARNKPYAGGYITQAYGAPMDGVHTLQIEINRALYIDEASLERHPGFERLCADLAGLAGDLAAAVPTLLDPLRAAAE